MRFPTIFAGVAAATGLGQAAAASLAHRSHSHSLLHKDSAEPAPFHMATHRLARRSFEQGLFRRGAHINEGDSQKLRDLGIPMDGLNYDNGDNGGAWIGVDGPFTNTFNNQAGEDIILIVWDQPWVTANQPLVTISMPAGCNRTVSFANGASGAWSAIHPSTSLDDAGMIFNTWGEYTFDPTYGTVDVSREVNMLGSSMTINTPNCVSDMDKCVFVCPEGQDRCYTEYILQDCETGSQPGASYGTDPYTGMPSGGCASLGSSAHLQTVLGQASS